MSPMSPMSLISLMSPMSLMSPLSPGTLQELISQTMVHWAQESLWPQCP